MAEVLVRNGGYEAAVDDTLINLIVMSATNYNKIGAFLNSGKATEYTYSRVIDAQVKLAKIINDGLHELGISPRDRREKGLTDSNSNKPTISSTIDMVIQAMAENRQASLSETGM